MASFSCPASRDTQRAATAGRAPWAFSPFWAETSKIATMQRRLITQASAHGWLHQRHRLVFPQIPIKRVLKHFAFWWDFWRVKTKNGPKGPYSLVFWRRRCPPNTPGPKAYSRWIVTQSTIQSTKKVKSCGKSHGGARCLFVSLSLNDPSASSTNEWRLRQHWYCKLLQEAVHSRHTIDGATRCHV